MATKIRNGFVSITSHNVRKGRDADTSSDYEIVYYTPKDRSGRVLFVGLLIVAAIVAFIVIRFL